MESQQEASLPRTFHFCYKPGTRQCTPVQDLNAISQDIEAICPMVPKPYTLIGIIPESSAWFTWLDKRMLCIRRSHHRHKETTRTRLPQRFNNSPRIFWEILATDINTFIMPGDGCTLLQYAADFLLAVLTWKSCYYGAKYLPHLLWRAWYKVLRKKPQICRQVISF